MPQRYLKRLSDGAKFAYTDALAAAPGLVECDASGRLIDTSPNAGTNLAGDAGLQKQLEYLEGLRDELREENQRLLAENDDLKRRLANAGVSPPAASAEATEEAPSMGVPPPEGDPNVNDAASGDLETLIEPIKGNKEALEALGKSRFGVDLDRRFSAAKMIERLRALEAEQSGEGQGEAPAA